MKIKVKYFAAMREQVGLSEELLETDAKTPGELLGILKQKHKFEIDESNLKVAINEEYMSFTSSIKELDTVVFIPPVAGG
ncbi:MAG: molybdopterin converting factor subunit 1 [Bacteriovoracaceae bacterium]|nr:molybdopterin converting factor subunit 1 [Bacteriovoracaceae bacterium]